MKTLISLLLALVFSSTAFSQLGIKGGIGLGVNISPNRFSHGGAALGLTYNFKERLRAEVLVEALFRKDNFTYLVQNTEGNSTMIESQESISSLIPITLGIDYKFLTGKIQPYAGLNAGIMTRGTRTDNQSYNSQYFLIQPKIGLNTVLTPNLLFDFTLKSQLMMLGNTHPQTITNTLVLSIGLNYAF